MLKLMKSHKIVSIVVVVVVALVIALVAFRSVWGGMIKSAALKQISAMTGTKVTLESLSFSPMAGSVEINGFVVGNPEGYHTDHALRFDALAVDLDVGSLFSDAVVIESILVDGLHVTFETGLTDNNLRKIQNNVKAYSKAKDKTVAEKPSESEPEGTKKKFVINKLDVVNGRVSVAARMIKGRGATLTLADIHLTDIGEKSGGASAAEVVFILIEAILDNAKNVADGTNAIFGKRDGVGDEVNDKAEKAINALKDMF